MSIHRIAASWDTDNIVDPVALFGNGLRRSRHFNVRWSKAVRPEPGTVIPAPDGMPQGSSAWISNRRSLPTAITSIHAGLKMKPMKKTVVGAIR
jgi:hypothetical protein